MVLNECKRWLTCSAPICPLDQNIDKAIWYPDEEICKNREMVKQHRFIKVQRKIQKKTQNRNSYYTLMMLKQITRVCKGTRGLSPETLSDKSWVARRSNPPIFRDEVCSKRGFYEHLKKSRLIYRIA